MKDEERARKVQEQVENLSKLVYHPLLGAILKYKFVFTRPFRFTLLFQRYFSGLLAAGIASTFLVYGISVYLLMLPPILSMVLYRLFEVICEKAIKRIQDADQVKLYRLLAGLFLFGMNAALWYCLVQLTLFVDEIFTLTWLITYAIAFAFDLLILDLLGIFLKLHYKRSTKHLKQAEKLKERKLPMHLMMSV